jgi:hypothetical protein
MAQAELITAMPREAIYQWWPGNLTWQGHEFLDASRDESFWNKAKGKLAGVTGGIGFELLKAVLLSQAKQQLGI